MPAFKPDPARYAFVHCLGSGDDVVDVRPSCGDVPLTELEYLRQLDEPDRSWECPKCGCPANYNDTLSEEAQGINLEGDAIADDEEEDDEDDDYDDFASNYEYDEDDQ